MDQKTTIKNVNILDLRKTAKETLDTIGFIRNVNLIAVSTETKAYLSGIPCKNLNAIVEFPSDVQLQTIMSNATINASYLSSLNAPMFMLVMGRLVVEPDASQEQIEEKIQGMVIMGKLICSEAVAGLLQGKATAIMGKTITYPLDAVLVDSSLTLNDTYLSTLQDGTRLVVTGSLRIVDDVTNDLINRKITEIRAHGSILCRQEHALTIKAKLTQQSTMTVIPAGHRLVEGNLTLDPLTLDALENEQLFSLGDIIITGDVRAEALDSAVAKVETLGGIVCPAGLKDVLKTKCNLLDNRVMLYKGTLWYVDEERQLVPDQFAYVDGPMTIIVRSELTVEPDVTPDSILDRIDKIHNLGEITCQPNHIAAIEARLGIREGAVTVAKPVQEEAPESGPSIGNANVMVL